VVVRIRFDLGGLRGLGGDRRGRRRGAADDRGDLDPVQVKDAPGGLFTGPVIDDRVPGWEVESNRPFPDVLA